MDRQIWPIVYRVFLTLLLLDMLERFPVFISFTWLALTKPANLTLLVEAKVTRLFFGSILSRE